MCAQRRLKSACAPRSLIRVFVVRMKKKQQTLHLWQSNMRTVKILMRLREAQADLNLHWTHMSAGTFSDVAALIITKTCPYNIDPLKPHFYIVKLGFTGVYIIFLISAQNIDCGYSLEPPRRGGSNEYPQSMF